MPETLSTSDLRRVLDLRLLIARAATSDAMNWWEDESLSDAGLRLAGRIFPRAPERAAARLAILAARNRHDVAVPKNGQVVHLFDLGDELEMEIEESFHAEYNVDVPAVMTSPDQLTRALNSLGVEIDTSTPVLETKTAVEVNAPQTGSAFEQARALAAAYVAGDVRQPVFPYIRLDQGT